METLLNNLISATKGNYSDDEVRYMFRELIEHYVLKIRTKDIEKVIERDNDLLEKIAKEVNVKY